jgi:hypothetical protein
MKFEFTNWWTFYNEGLREFSFNIFSFYIDREKGDRLYRFTIFNFEFEWRDSLY